MTPSDRPCPDPLKHDAHHYGDHRRNQLRYWRCPGRLVDYPFPPDTPVPGPLAVGVAG